MFVSTSKKVMLYSWVWLLIFIVVVFFSRFKFTKVFSGNASQEHVYNECVHNLVRDFINGKNCLLFAYGTSSAGKTYTIQGRLCYFFFGMQWI